MTPQALPTKVFPSGMPLELFWGYLEGAWNTSNIKDIFNWSPIPAETAFGVIPAPPTVIFNFERIFLNHPCHYSVECWTAETPMLNCRVKPDEKQFCLKSGPLKAPD